jgi:hypothetical protein
VLFRSVRELTAFVKRVDRSITQTSRRVDRLDQNEEKWQAETIEESNKCSNNLTRWLNHTIPKLVDASVAYQLKSLNFPPLSSTIVLWDVFVFVPPECVSSRKSWRGDHCLFRLDRTIV